MAGEIYGVTILLLLLHTVVASHTRTPPYYCPALPDVDNGMITYQIIRSAGNESYMVATYSCDDGHTLVGESTFTCQSDTQWSSTTAPYCAVSCPLLPEIDNGSITYDPFNSSKPFIDTTTIAIYTCNESHLLIGESSRSCQSNGTWSSTPPSCIERPPVYLSNLFGDIYTSNNSEILNTNVYLRCHSDLNRCCGRYRQPGTVANWLYPDGRVIPPKPTEGEAYYSYRSRFTWQYMRLIQVDAGPNGVYCCVIPTSIGEQRFCVHLVRCLSLPPLLNGMIAYNSPASFRENTVATYSCNYGYLLIGESTRTCQSDITWSNTAPYCIALCPPPPTPNNGVINYLNLRNSSLVENTTATYSCNNGYLLIGESTRTCQSDRTWSNTAPYCADSAMIQLKFAPTDHCIQWNENKASLIHLHMRGAIIEAILSKGNITIPLEHIEEGFFSCRTSHNQTTYRTKIIGIETAGAIEITSFVQTWVESGATVRVQWYIVEIDKICPVIISSMSEAECGQDPGIQRCVDICVARGRQ